MSSIMDSLLNSSPKARSQFAKGAAAMARDYVLKYGIKLEKDSISIGVYKPSSHYRLINMYVMLRDTICKYYYVSTHDYYSILEKHGIKMPFRIPEGNDMIYRIGRKVFEQTDFFGVCKGLSLDQAIHKFLNLGLEKDD